VIRHPYYRKAAHCVIALQLLLAISSLSQEQRPDLVLQIGHTENVSCIAFSSDGKLIASGGFDNTIKLWVSETGLLLRTFTGHSGYVHSVLFSDDGKKIISRGSDATIRFWDIASGRVIRTLS
jgi:WD40 repeat protein